MADIIITPASSLMAFTSSLNYKQTITQEASGSLTLLGSGSTGRTDLFTINGNNGTLFSVSDDLSNSLFSVNTIAGLPVIEAFANNNVIMGAYGQNDFIITGSKVGIGTSSPGSKLTVNGIIESLPVSNSEGGQLTLRAGSSYSYRWNVDNYQDNFRIFREDDPTSSNGLVAVHINSLGNTGIGTTSPATSAILDLTATNRGFLPPRMTTDQINNISSPAEGLIVYDNITKEVKVFNGSLWETLKYA